MRGSTARSASETMSCAPLLMIDSSATLASTAGQIHRFNDQFLASSNRS